MSNFYNVRKKKFANGLVEIAIYEKAVEIGGVNSRSNKKKKYVSYEVENVPFDDAAVKFEKFERDDGFQHEYKNYISLYKSLYRTRSKIFDYANSNKWEWFVTFTFDSEKVDRFNYLEISKKFSKWLTNMRFQYCPDMKYLVVPELHKNGAYHFHGLFSDCVSLDFSCAVDNREFLKSGKINRNFGKDFKINGEQIYNIKKYKLGFSYCMKVRDTKKISNYIVKYITKEFVSSVKNRKRYWNSQNLQLPIEEKTLIAIVDYDKLCSDVVKAVSCCDFNLCVNDCKIEHGDFVNHITYIRYDSSKNDIEFFKNF